MRVRISEPELLPELVDFLRARADVVVVQLAEDEIDTGLIGSYSHEAQGMALELHLRAWQAAHRGVEFEIEGSSPHESG